SPVFCGEDWESDTACQRRSQLKQIAVARDARLDAGRAQAVPKACLVGRDHRPLQILLERLQDRHAAKARARDQHAIGLSRAGRLDLGVERLDLLLETEALARQLTG